MPSWGEGGEREVDSFTQINNMAYVNLLSYSLHFEVFFAIGPVLAKLK